MSTTDPDDQKPYVRYTNRLILRLADPLIDEDCELITRTYTDNDSGKGGHGRVGIQTIEDVRMKYKTQGPLPELCSLDPTVRGMYLLIFLLKTVDSKDVEGDFIGIVGISFRREMPFPDMGWSIFGPYQGQGYATEAGREGVKFWRDVIGVRKLSAIAMEGNEKSHRLAERIGFVKSGTLDIHFGDEKVLGRGFVLPGMDWPDGLAIWPEIKREQDER